MVQPELTPDMIFDPDFLPVRRVSGTMVEFQRGKELLLQNVAVHSVFWGPVWDDASLSPLRAHVTRFFEVLLNDPKLAELLASFFGLQEDKVSSFLPQGHISGHIVPFATKAEVSDQDIREMLKGHIAEQSINHTAESLYAVFLPPGVDVTYNNFRSCLHFCGYHEVDSSSSPSTFYAVIPFPACAGCSRRLPLKDALTAIASHELFNTVTDPVYGRGWFDPAHGEIADPCTPLTETLANEANETFVRRKIWVDGRCQ